MGRQRLLKYLGVKLNLRVLTDAMTGKSLASRTGLGKVRHIAENKVWLQSHVHDKKRHFGRDKEEVQPFGYAQQNVDQH